MQLEFHYGAEIPFIDYSHNSLRVGITNSGLNAPIESWKIPEGKYERRGHFHYLENDDYILGAASVKVDSNTLMTTTLSIYEQLLTARPHMSLYRIWHFVPSINEIPDNCLENYRAFCKGRSIAFDAQAKDALRSSIPAASAVGTTGEHLTVVYLAGRAGSTHIENPRQTPAYEYPEKYGPKSPTFARATSTTFNGAPILFISGTASILASESIGDTLESQLKVTLENLNIVADRSNAATAIHRRARIYIRHAEDYDTVKAALEQHYLTPNDEAIYIVADICRKELLVEIEVTTLQ
ncbi:MAG: pteridine-dependent deoxygenase like protein [Opitutaceae bacterium]